VIDAIAIDGPAGAGKSTVARLVARKLGFTFLDTGAMYRCAALAAERRSVDAADEAAVTRVAEQISIHFEHGDPQRVFLDEDDVTTEIRQERIGDLASRVSVYRGVRKAMVRLQKMIAGNGHVVMEGRDTTTVVCPDARLKVFLTASPDERAQRRMLELQSRGEEADFQKIRSEIVERDKRDSSREHSPLMIAPGAVVIDTDEMSVNDVVDRVIEAYYASAVG
jgi:cytidylate kinase